MTPAFFDEIGRVFKMMDNDDKVNVCIIRGEGRMFSAGLALDAVNLISEGDPIEQHKQFLYKLQKWQKCFTRIETCKKPVIAAIHGHCIGGGIDLITTCDIRLCTADAKFCVGETKIAIVADLGTLQRLPRIVSRGMAREMVFTSMSVDAERAQASGLVNRIYADYDALLQGARALARQIASLSPLTVQGCKVVMNYSEQHSVADGLKFVGLWNGLFIESDDLKEAVMAFMQKRNPSFKNRL
eukprot:TRINITY_DN20422_c0_g1_i1.p1 TRINITY_DN20422_c0_g1~~TRINITY_DN20422_c0_g1_i1.p1  ORF type:complete len:261 (-),score=28.44 TRINITY_DN20422_c0_g1_i1:3-728(-)